MCFPRVGGLLCLPVPSAASRGGYLPGAGVSGGTLVFSSRPSGRGTTGILESRRTGVTFGPQSLTLWRYLSPFQFSFGIACFFVFSFFFMATPLAPDTSA